MIEKLAQIETDEVLYKEMKEICTDRWSEYHSPMHAAALVVDPYFQSGKQYADGEVSTGWDKVLDKLVPDLTLQRTIKNQLAEYRGLKKKFEKANAFPLIHVW